MHPFLRKTVDIGTHAAVLLMLAGACQGSVQTETETHFLSACSGNECPSGMSCICGVCTTPCENDSACERLSQDATCSVVSPVCTATNTVGCDVECSATRDCASLGPEHACVSGKCRHRPRDGSGGSSGVSTGGQSNVGTGGQSSGTGGAVGTGGASAEGCNERGAPCCDPFPGDGPNYCEGGLVCGAFNRCGLAEVDCECALGAYFPVCGADGTTYDATCGTECVPAEIACRGECPCECTPDRGKGCSAETGSGIACCEGLECCEGVPYDMAGECHRTCELRSDRGAKMDIAPADPEALLQSVARLPISTWRYRSDPGARHVGPMAQDFAAELGLGRDDRVIAAVDASGVALASIQALHARLERLARENEDLKRRVRTLEAER